MSGYWSVSHRNILGIPKRVVEEVDDLGAVVDVTGATGDCSTDVENDLGVMKASLVLQKINATLKRNVNAGILDVILIVEVPTVKQIALSCCQCTVLKVVTAASM